MDNLNYEDEEDRCPRASELGIRFSRGRSKAVDRAYGRLSVEDLPSRTKMQERDYDWYRYHEGPRSNMLDSMVRKGVGRPWDKVHSELVAYVKENYARDNWHDILHRLEWMVELHPMHIGNGVYVQATGRPFYSYRNHDNTFLVHPETGLLMRPKKAWTEVKFESIKKDHRYWWKDPVAYIQNRCYRKVDGYWYEVELAVLPSAPKTYNYNDHYSKAYGENDWLWKLNLRDVVMKCRLRSTMSHDLKICHGYRTYQNKLVSRDEFQKMMGNELRRSYYVSSCYPSFMGHTVYAKSLRMISKAEINRLQLVESKLIVPDIVR